MSTLNVVVSPLASEDEDRLSGWFMGQSLDLARRFLVATQATYADLAQEPGMGALYECDMRLLEGMRKKGVNGFLNYLIFYRVEGRTLRILRVLDGRRDLPKVIAWEVHEESVPYGTPMDDVAAKAQLDVELLKGLNSPVAHQMTVEEIPAYLAERKAALLGRHDSISSHPAP